MRRSERADGVLSGVWTGGVTTAHVISTRVCAASFGIILKWTGGRLRRGKRRLNVAAVCHGLFSFAFTRPSASGHFGGKVSMRRGGHKLMPSRSWWPPSVYSRTRSLKIVRMSISGGACLQLRWPPRSWLSFMSRSGSPSICGLSTTRVLSACWSAT